MGFKKIEVKKKIQKYDNAVEGIAHSSSENI